MSLAHRKLGNGIKFVLSYGAGVNSTALMVYLLEKGKHLDCAVFADTGAELPETYRYLRIAKKYLRDHGVGLEVVRSKNGSLFDTCRKRRVIPSMLWRWSTRDYKITPVYRFYRSFALHVNQYVGIAYDEIERMKPSHAYYVTNLYPLVDAKMTREDCEDAIHEAGLPTPVKSGCFFCPFNSIDRWREIFGTHPDLFEKAIFLEENSKHFPKQRLAASTLKDLARSFSKCQTDALEMDVPCGSECMT